ncbi:ABC-type transport system substrate-binding protein [Bradyrhizobium sp. GM22.5]
MNTQVKLFSGFAAKSAVIAISAFALNAFPALAQDAAVVVGWESTVDSLNPAVSALRDVAPIDNNIFDTLVWVTPDFKITPDLATSWDVSDGGKLYTFKLRQDVTFHDGTPFNAAAVVANFEYITNADSKARSGLSTLGPCLTAKAVDELTVQNRLQGASRAASAQPGHTVCGHPVASCDQKVRYGTRPAPYGYGALRLLQLPAKSERRTDTQ